MDESVINGANLFFPQELGIPQTGPDSSKNEWLLGLVNGAPYVRAASCSRILACMLIAA